MKLRILLFSLIQITVLNAILAAPPSYKTTPDGLIIFTDSLVTGTTNAVRLEVIADNIIRVIAAPSKEIMPAQSLITVYKKRPDIFWEVIPSKGTVMLKTKKITAVVDLRTGAVTFRDGKGEKILSEKQPLGRSFQPSVFEGERYYKLVQTFQTSPGDAWYGLGQHQDGIYNYRGQQVSLFQNNTEVAIPFLVSCRNYGILWDNYSLTTAGDTRPLHELSALQLFSKQGEAGWLTASYANNKLKPQEVTIERAEGSIDMPFLGDSKLQLPPSFSPSTGSVTWEGSIASYLSGLHQFRLTFGGSIKVWLNEKLVLDHWRKAWNPAPATIPIHFKKGEKIHVKIEWVPEGGESYLSFKWQEPLTPAEQNSFGFSSEAGRQIDYYFIYGNNMDDVIAGYRDLTGKAPIVPKWALGFWQSRERYKTQAEMLTTIDEFRKREIPIDNIVLDWSYWKEAGWGSQEFDEARFPSPDSMIDVLHKKYNTHLMISVWPKFYEGIAAYNEFDKKGWLYKRNIADRQRDWIGKGYVSTFYDAFNADARKGFWNLICNKIYSKGIDAWWMDASEPDILSNVSPEKRKLQMTPTALGSAAEYLNAYPLQNAKGIYEGQRAYDPGKRVFLLTRSGFAGSQRYAAAIWSGDIGSTWRDMKNQIAAGVNFSMSGVPYWTMDIGGFVVPEKFEKPDAENLEEWRELNTRWYQFGAFVPLFRAHGQFPYREIFNIAPDDHAAYKSILYYDKLRYRLLPYTYSLAGAAYHENSTIMRGLVMDFAQDTAVLNIGDQYMFGPSLLVNPVYTYKQRDRELYLPKCAGWYDLYSGKWYAGGQRINAAAGYERMPVFVKAGSIIPFGPALQYTSEKPADTITLNVYAGADAYFGLYEDEGTNYNYEKGAFALIPIKYTEATRTVTIGDRKGSFNGMLQKRTFRVNFITTGKAMGCDLDARGDKEVVYDGKNITIKMVQ
ncbi:glycoside hydrolase family 31 protein [Flavitalea sp. BT771]|uniref:glycoside hydrolase family 31 protein n=1 Tax=Flavitalea sp. BT771 TaxID=3063329 RepID=UPI0026E49603|nr:TIM-barrel domain-containing protein [Flavitalea sp. BT771]MDO6430311.1 glycoside hydrolase family 31 protein [Flavitalea sp. BT771]MDV6219549.1 glycoside hydrolase family 31 protein [Flavitalea sp. BT771]